MAETMQRNPFFLPSGFEPQEIINILEAKRDNKKRLDKIKERKRAERKEIRQGKDKTIIKVYDKIIKLHKTMTIHNRCKPFKKSTKTVRILPYIKNGFKHFTAVEAIDEDTDQIQRGYDLATRWGWDGINRPYTPKIMSVFGGNKRKHR